MSPRFFETRKRDSGETFTTLADDAPEWLRDAVYDAHMSDGPDDWTYAECAAAYDACVDGLDEDGLHEHADGRVEIYTKPLYQWAADHCLGSVFGEAESDADDCGLPEDTTPRLMVVQYHAILRIARTILAAYEANEKSLYTVVVEGSDDDPFSVTFHVQAKGADRWADRVGSIDGGTWERADKGGDFIYDHGTLRPGCFDEWERDGWNLDCSMAPSDDPFDVFYGFEGDELEAEMNRYTAIGLHENKELKEEIRARQGTQGREQVTWTPGA